MKTPYVPHIFGEQVQRKLAGRRGWLTAGVASSIPWPGTCRGTFKVFTRTRERAAPMREPLRSKYRLCDTFVV